MSMDRKESRNKLLFRDDNATGDPDALTSIADYEKKVREQLNDIMVRHKREPTLLRLVREQIAFLDGQEKLTYLDLNRSLNKATQADLGFQLVNAAREGDADTITKLRGDRAPLNFRDPRTGATALHYVAAFRARPAFRALTEGATLDYMIRDSKGRLAWELAFDADDTALARLLIQKTRAQAEAAGVPFPPRRPPAEIPTPR